MLLDFRTILYRAIHGHAAQRVIGLGLVSFFGVSSLAMAATLCVSRNARFGCRTTISAAVAAASPGDVIQVWPGTYREQVTITKSISLVGTILGSPIIDATGRSNGILINGISAAPNPGVANVLIQGFTVRNANFEGILIVNGSNITILRNHVLDNNKALDVGGGTCPGIPAFETNEGMDCGEGIHLMAADHSSIVSNEVEDNSGGILTTDETGASRDNVISGNSVHDNPYACGITMASHGPATTVIPTATVSFGVIHNTVIQNDSTHNGMGIPGAGAGVGIFAPGPGATSSGNFVVDNDLRNNGLPGVTMHNHAAFPAPAPPVNLNDNIIVGNRISGNAADTADAATSGPTGINVYSVAPITGTVISQNVIDNEAIGVAFNAPVGQLNMHLNDFEIRGMGVDNIGAGTIDATVNWWNCPKGPGGRGCASVTGKGVAVAPWLTFPFETSNNRYW